MPDEPMPPAIESPLPWDLGEPAESPEPTNAPEVDPRATARTALWIGIFVLFCGIAGALLGGSGEDFFTAGLEVVPFAALAFLAHLGRRRVWALVLAGLTHPLLLVLASWTMPLLVMMVLSIQAGWEPGSENNRAMGQGLREGWLSLAFILAWSFMALVVAAALLFPPARRWAARYLPLDPASLPQALALSMVAGMTLLFFGPLLATGGQPALLVMIQASPAMAKDIAESNVIGSMLYSLVWIVPGAIVATGFPVVRRLPEALERLGFVRPTSRQVLGAILLAAALYPAWSGLDWLIESVWKALGWPRTDEEAVEQLFRSAATPIGAVVLAVSAGVSEELAVRGLLQPRLGLLVSNLFFTSLHALQYSFDGLLSVFLAGMVLGLIRTRTNTTTSAIVHGLYDLFAMLEPMLTGSSS
jgi:hypothetical protein